MRLSVALRLGRVSNLPTVWTNVVAAVALAGGDPPPLELAGLAGAMSLFYVGGMYLNDAFDRDWDRRHRPERPIPRQETSAAAVFGLGFLMLALGLAAVAALGRGASPAILSALALGACVVLYDAFHKQNPLSPLVMGLCRAGVYTTSALVVAPALDRAVLLGAGALVAYLIGLTYVARQESLSEVKHLWPLALLAAPVLYAAPRALGDGATAFFAVGLVGWVTYALGFLRQGRRNIPRAVVSLIAGISLLDALLICQHGRPALALAAAAGFLATLALQRFIPGT